MMDEPLRLVSDAATSERAPAPLEQARDFEDLVEAEHTELYGALCLITRDRFEAEDVMQEAFLKVWERWDRVRGMEDPTGYLYRAAMNLYRKRPWRSGARSVSLLPATNSPKSRRAMRLSARSQNSPQGSA